MSNNQELTRLMAKYKLSQAKISELLLIGVSTVASWTVKPESKRFRNMPDCMLKLLQLQIKDKRLKPAD